MGRRRRQFLQTTRYANRCYKISGGHHAALWSWCRRAQGFWRQDRAGTRMSYGWVPR